MASASSHQTTADVESVNNRPKVSGADTAPNLAALQPVETLDAERSVVQNVVYAINYTVDMAVVVVVATAEASTTQQVAAMDFMVVMTAASLDMVAANFLAAAKPKVDTVANLGTAAASFLVVARSSVVAHNSAVQAELTLKKQ